MCAQLLSEKHPGLEIRHVDGAGGDKGLDVFLGELRDKPAIWQCKHFPNGLRARQRPQVLDSLRTAICNFHPRAWILVVPIDLDEKSHSWFEKVKHAYATKVALGLFQASDIVRELIHRRNLRDAFFPNAVLDSVTVQRAISGIGKTDASTLDSLAKESIDELVARLEEHDARFTYQVVYGPNVGSEIAEYPPSHPLLLASVGDTRKRIDVFARDLQALRLDPPSTNFTLNDVGFRKLQEFLRTGRKQELNVGEVSSLRSTFDFLLPDKQLKEWKLVLMPSQSLEAKRLKLKLTFTRNDESVQYEYVEFKMLRVGSDEAEIESMSRIPFVISLTLPLREPFEATIGIAERFEGAEVRQAARALRALSLMREGALVEIYDLEAGKPLGKLQIVAPELRRFEGLEAFVRDASKIAERLGLELLLPGRLEMRDFEQVAFLKAAVDGTPLPANSFSGEMVKRAPQIPSDEIRNAKFLEVIVAVEKMSPSPRVLGVSVDTGPMVLTLKRAEITRAKEFWRKYERAAPGRAIPFELVASEMHAGFGQVGEFGVFVKPASAP